jgi:hypothetical protein
MQIGVLFLHKKTYFGFWFFSSSFLLLWFSLFFFFLLGNSHLHRVTGRGCKLIINGVDEGVVSK